MLTPLHLPNQCMVKLKERRLKSQNKNPLFGRLFIFSGFDDNLLGKQLNYIFSGKNVGTKTLVVAKKETEQLPQFPQDCLIHVGIQSAFDFIAPHPLSVTLSMAGLGWIAPD